LEEFPIMYYWRQGILSGELVDWTESLTTVRWIIALRWLEASALMESIPNWTHSSPGELRRF
jgi:hypothetical protein